MTEPKRSLGAGLKWYRVRVWRPVRFTHGTDGFLRGGPGSPRDDATRKRSKWFEIVERTDDVLIPPAYRPVEEHRP